MDNWLRRSALDTRFVDLAIFMSVLIWPWLLIATFFTVIIAWKFVLLCQVIALPFSVFGWSAGFRLGRRCGWAPRNAAMLAGWSGLLMAEVGLALVLYPWFQSAAAGPGLWAFPGLAVLVTVGVLWFYRAETWRGRQFEASGDAV